MIRNTATNQDGKTSSITLPSGDAQFEMIERAYRAAALDPVDTSYVEAHGTGTPAGDPIEAAALSKVFAPGRPLDRPIKGGSIKSNIGHLEGGSGIAGVVKTVMMLENSLILPNFDFQKANPGIPMYDWGLDVSCRGSSVAIALTDQVPTTVQPWPAEDVRRASINNFGFGGSNAHAIVDDTRGYLSSRGLINEYERPAVQSSRINGLPGGVNDVEATGLSRVLVLTAFNESSGRQQLNGLVQYLNSPQDEDADGLLDSLAFTLGERRSVLPWKAVFTANSIPQMLDAVSEDKLKFSKLPKAKDLGFIFTGQGAQWHGMGKELVHQYPCFQRSLTAADHHLRALGAPWSLFGGSTLLSTCLANRCHS